MVQLLIVCGGADVWSYRQTSMGEVPCDLAFYAGCVIHGLHEELSSKTLDY